MQPSPLSHFVNIKKLAVSVHNDIAHPHRWALANCIKSKWTMKNGIDNSNNPDLLLLHVPGYMPSLGYPIPPMKV